MRRTRWNEHADGQAYTATTNSLAVLPPGIYNVTSLQNVGLVYTPVDAKNDAILRFPDSASDLVVQEIEQFWERESLFRAHALPHKRGILLHGPPGSGKSTTIQLVARDVVARSGVVFVYSTFFLEGFRTFREVEPDTPVVCLMEDLDSILTPNNESQILNMLDGIESMSRCVFVASTNYPEKLGPRITNRPSRFDRKILIGHPSLAARETYLASLVRPGDDVNLAQWVLDTDGFSLAHLKELFISVVLLGNDYRMTRDDLRKMRETSHSTEGEPDQAGAQSYL